METRNLAELYDLAPLDREAVSAALPEGQAGDAAGGASALHADEPGGATTWTFDG
jgi:hypothetical protein